MSTHGVQYPRVPGFPSRVLSFCGRYLDRDGPEVAAQPDCEACIRIKAAEIVRDRRGEVYSRGGVLIVPDAERNRRSAALKARRKAPVGDSGGSTAE